MTQQQIPENTPLIEGKQIINANAADVESRYPAGDPSAPTDGYVWTYDAASGGWLPKSTAHSHAKLDRLPDIETSQRVVYVSPTGSDTTGDGSSANRWATIQHAVDQARAILQPANGTSAYKIMCAAGTYEGRVTVPPNLFASYVFGGQGGIWITSESGVASDVIITDSATHSAAVMAYGSLTLEYVTIEQDNAAVWARGGPGTIAYVKNCTLRRRSASDGGLAALAASVGSIVSHNNSSVTDRRFAYGLRAEVLAVIGKAGGQPTGSTANELVQFGGAIR